MKLAAGLEHECKCEEIVQQLVAAAQHADARDVRGAGASSMDVELDVEVHGDAVDMMADRLQCPGSRLKSAQDEHARAHTHVHKLQAQVINLDRREKSARRTGNFSDGCMVDIKEEVVGTLVHRQTTRREILLKAKVVFDGRQILRVSSYIFMLSTLPRPCHDPTTTLQLTLHTLSPTPHT